MKDTIAKMAGAVAAIVAAALGDHIAPEAVVTIAGGVEQVMIGLGIAAYALVVQLSRRIFGA